MVVPFSSNLVSVLESSLLVEILDVFLLLIFYSHQVKKYSFEIFIKFKYSYLHRLIFSLFQRIFMQGPMFVKQHLDHCWLRPSPNLYTIFYTIMVEFWNTLKTYFCATLYVIVIGKPKFSFLFHFTYFLSLYLVTKLVQVPPYLCKIAVHLAHAVQDFRLKIMIWTRFGGALNNRLYSWLPLP